MTRKLMTSAALCLVLALPMPGASAQPTAAASSVATADHELKEMKELAEQGARLKKETEAALAELAEKERTLDGLVADVRSARQFVDDLIGLLRATAERLAPDGAYMKTLQTQEELVRGLAREALASSRTAEHPFGERLNEQAATIGALRTEARELAGRLSAEIDRLASSKPQLGYAYAVARTERFIETARGYLATVRRVLHGTSEAAACKLLS
jgi:hypothetical protein